MWGDEASQIRRVVRKLMGHVFPILVFINKVLLAQSRQSTQALSSVAMGLQWQIWAIQQRPRGLQSLRLSLSGPFQKKWANPWLTIFN